VQLKDLSTEMRKTLLEVAEASETIARANGETVAAVLARNLPEKRPVQPAGPALVERARGVV
jgi:hypothetical protein